MAKCPKCGKEAPTPTKELKTYICYLREYTCPQCQHRFVTDG